jgi:hypothetical protein
VIAGSAVVSKLPDNGLFAILGCVLMTIGFSVYCLTQALWQSKD